MAAGAGVQIAGQLEPGSDPASSAFYVGGKSTEAGAGILPDNRHKMNVLGHPAVAV
jgi:hypothetical protein